MKTCRSGVVFFGLGLSQSGLGHLNVEALLRLVTELNAHTRFYARRMRVQGDVAGADSVLCWQTGYPFSVNLSRGYPRYNPGEYSANDLLERRGRRLPAGGQRKHAARLAGRAAASAANTDRGLGLPDGRFVAAADGSIYDSRLRDSPPGHGLSDGRDSDSAANGAAQRLCLGRRDLAANRRAVADGIRGRETANTRMLFSSLRFILLSTGP